MAKKPRTTYRESAALTALPERYGFLKCPQYRPEKPHKCSPPGFFERLRLSVSEGDMWRCPECGKCYMWRHNGSDRLMRSWVRADDSYWRQVCAMHLDDE